MQWVLLIGDEGLSAKDFADMRFKNSSKVGSGRARGISRSCTRTDLRCSRTMRAI